MMPPTEILITTHLTDVAMSERLMSFIEGRLLESAVALEPDI